jgi:hypothetical protein
VQSHRRRPAVLSCTKQPCEPAPFDFWSTGLPSRSRSRRVQTAPELSWQSPSHSIFSAFLFLSAPWLLQRSLPCANVSQTRSGFAAACGQDRARFKTRWYLVKRRSWLNPMTRKQAVTVRLPGAKSAPTNKTLACSQTGLENSGANSTIGGNSSAGSVSN